MNISGRGGTLAVSEEIPAELLQLTVPEHYLDLIDITLAEKTRARTVIKRDPEEPHGPDELLREMDISRE